MATGFTLDTSSAYPWIFKDPADSLPYTLDWSAWLGADTISGAPVWTVPTGLTKVSQSNTGTSATAVISGGTPGKAYVIACRITTAAGAVAERSLELRVRSR